MNIDILKFFIIIFTSIFILSSILIIFKKWVHRFMLLSILCGLIWYSGIGASEYSVATYYILYFFILAVSIICGFFISLKCFLGFSVLIGKRISLVLGQMKTGKGWILLISFYCFLALFYLVWPEMKIGRIISPPPPDIRAAFNERFEGEIGTITRIIDYAKYLLMPFFYIALFRLRYNFKRIAFVLFILIYLQYVKNGYIGRGAVLLNIAFFIMALWISRPQYRKNLVYFIFLISPFVLYSFYWYGRIRLSASIDDISFFKAIFKILEAELSFPKNTGMVLLESGKNVNLKDYFTWIFTLPVPKVLIGPISGARVNYEISEIVLGLQMGSPKWYVVLPGLVAESVYIYGHYFFWFHGFFIGFIAGFFVRLLEKIPQAIFLLIYIVLMFGYALNRAGISSLMPLLVNYFILFYLFIFIFLFLVSPPQRKGY